ncbi:MAG: HEAT repeat domain-containing protein [Myxococcota bacterium]
MSIRNLRMYYQRIWREDVSYEEKREFVAALLERHDSETLSFHFELLRNQEHFYFYCSIRAAFKHHGPPAEAFLIDRFRREQDPHLRGDALQILGTMRSKHARALAKEVVAAEAETLRYRGVIVLGWVGTVRDMTTVLRDRVLSDPSAFVRGNAATAFRQVWYGKPRAREPPIEILGEALRSEEDEEVICSIVVTLQDVMKRRFGIREPRDEPGFVGDAAKAKERALRAVAKGRGRL